MSTHFFKKLAKDDVISTHFRMFPFRDGEIGVSVDVNQHGVCVDVTIGSINDKHIEIEEIADYGRLLVAVDAYVDECKYWTKPK